MKKIILLTFCVFVYSFCIAQAPAAPLPQYRILTNPLTRVHQQGGFQTDSVFIVPSFDDTTAANRGPYPKFYAGNLIRTGDSIWIRNRLANRWNLLDFPTNGNRFGVSGEDYLAQQNRNFSGNNDTYHVQLDSINAFSAWRSGISRISMNASSSQLTSPNGLNSVFTSNTMSSLDFNSSANYLRVINDSSLFHKRASYEGNIHSTFFPYSLVDKSYVDSVAGGAGNSWSLTGNVVTAGSETGHFIGSTNNVSWRWRTNNIERGYLDSIGRLSFGGAPFISAGDGIVTRAKNTTAFNYSLFIGDNTDAEILSVANNSIVQVGNFRSFVVGGSSATATFNGATTLNSTATVNNTTGITISEMSTPSTPSSGFSRVYPKSDGRFYGIDDAGNEIRLSNPSLNKGAFIELPVATDTIDVWQTPVAITITSLKAILRGSSSPSVTYNMAFGTNIQSPTAVFTSNITCTSITTECSNSSGFNDATIPAGSFVWIYITAQSGTVRSIGFTINYTED